MNEKLKELTEKIYSEGIDKAKNEASEIIQNAQKEADKLRKEAQNEAAKIIEDAKNSALQQQTNMESEIRLSTRQAINALKQQIADLIVTQISRDEAQNALKNSEFVQKIMEKVIAGFLDNKNSNIDLNIILTENEKISMEEYFKNRQQNLLQNGLQVKFSDKINAGFEIAPKDNSFKISFTDETFEAFFKNYLRPRSIKLLYGDK